MKDVENELSELKVKLRKLEEEQIDGQENAEKLNRLSQLEITNDNGELINNDMI